MRRAYQLFVLLLIMFAVLSAGCLSQQKSAMQTKTSGISGGEYFVEDNVALKSELESSYDAGFSKDSDEAGETTVIRKVITTGDLAIEVNDASAAVDEIISITQAAGGFVSSSSVYDNYYGESTGKAGYVTVRIPQSGFSSVMDEIEAIGAVTSKSISGRDVTEEFVDLSARLGNLERQELRLLDILNMTTTVDEVLDVERELGRIRGEIESLTGG